MLMVTGGAGYIGAHVVRSLLRDGHEVVVLDDLSTGRPELVPDGVPLETGAVCDSAFVADVLDLYDVDSVVHLAGRKAVDESTARPGYYYRENVFGMLSILEAMVRTDMRSIVFSSSAAVYGTTDCERVTENSPTNPASPYGRTKLMCEWMLRDIAAAEGISWTALRYFNVAGAGEPSLADRGARNLVPKVFQALDEGLPPTVYGDDYETPDGTCIRDYIHVADLADAHAAVVPTTRSARTAATYNVGRGHGASVLEVMRAVQRASGVCFDWRVGDRRAGDPARVVADAERMSRDLGWQARRDLDDIVSSAWQAWSGARPVAAVPGEEGDTIPVGT